MIDAKEYDVSDAEAAELVRLTLVALKEKREDMPECGVDFCSWCGDCLHCYHYAGCEDGCSDSGRMRFTDALIQEKEGGPTYK